MILEEKDKQEILSWPEMTALIDERIKQKGVTVNSDKCLLTSQMAERYQVSRYSIMNLSLEELLRLGWKRVKLGTSVRYERVSVSDMTYKEAKKR